ncbi:unnamed protein product [Closterium sp. NIES-54]
MAKATLGWYPKVDVAPQVQTTADGCTTVQVGPIVCTHLRACARLSSMGQRSAAAVAHHRPAVLAGRLFAVLAWLLYATLAGGRPCCAGHAPSGVSQVDPLPGTVPVEVTVLLERAGAEPGGAESEGAGSAGAEPGGAEPAGADPGGAEPAGAEPKGTEPGGAKSEGAESGGAEPRVEGYNIFGFERILTGIQHQLTVPYNPQQNGVAEHFNRTLQEGARTLLGCAGLPDPFWVTAMRQVALVKNRVLATVGDKQWVPYTKWYGSTPAVNMLRAYGCMVVFHVPKEKRGKLEASGRWGVHLGLAKDHKGWLIWDLTKQQLTVSRDVKFLESLYYKEWKQRQQNLPTTPLIIEADEVQRPSRQVQVTISEEKISGVTEDGGEPEVEEQQQQQQQQDGTDLNDERYRAYNDERLIWDLQWKGDVHKRMWQIPVLPWRKSGKAAAAASMEESVTEEEQQGVQGEELIGGSAAVKASATSGQADWETWHRRLAHVAVSTLEVMHKEKCMDGAREAGEQGGVAGGGVGTHQPANPTLPTSSTPSPTTVDRRGFSTNVDK